MADWLGGQTLNLEVAGSTLALTTYTVAGVVSWYTPVQLLLNHVIFICIILRLHDEIK